MSNINAYTATGTWTCPAGVTTAIVRCWAGGGGGGGAASIGAGGGGAGGAFAIANATAVTPGTAYTVTVGAAGTAGASGQNNGGTGGDSWFNTSGTVIAKGGAGGTGGPTSSAGAGASGSTTGCIGDSVFKGGNGGTGSIGSVGGGGGGGAGTTGAGGNASAGTAGTGTTLSGGNGAAGPGPGSGGTAGSVYGGAGSGGCAPGGSGVGGGAGAAGRVEVEWTTSAGFNHQGTDDYRSVTTGQGSFTVAAGTVGNLRVLDSRINGSTTISISSLSGGGVASWQRAGSTFASDGSLLEIWYGTITDTGTSLTITYSSAIGSINVRNHRADFSGPLGSSLLCPYVMTNSATNTGTSATVTFPSVTTAAAGELYYGTGWVANTASGGSTAGYVYSVDSSGNPQCYRAISGPGSTEQPTCTQNSSGSFDVVAAVFYQAHPTGPGPRQGVNRAGTY